MSSGLNPCGNLNDLADSKLSSLEQIEDELLNTVDSTKRKLRDYASVPSSLDVVNGAINEATTDQLGLGQNAMTEIRKFTGTCLDQVSNEARKVASAIDDYVSENLNKLTSMVALPEYDILKPIRAYLGKLEEYDITNLIREIDKIFGCLADEGSLINECQWYVQSFSDRLDAVIANLGLNDDGSFTIDDFVNNFNINIDTSVLDNLNNLDGKVTELASEGVKNIRATISNTVNPSSRF